MVVGVEAVSHPQRGKTLRQLREPLTCEIKALQWIVNPYRRQSTLIEQKPRLGVSKPVLH